MKKMVDGTIVNFTAADIQQAETDNIDYEQNVLPREIRSQRNSLLAETDYLALSDTTLSDDMQTYRQALRDVTSQAGFPADVTWPTKP